jgi:hypothetical protein
MLDLLMKIISLILICLGISQGIFAQDLIIKTNGDSIPCRIKDLGALYISYHYNQYGKITPGNIPTQQVKTFQYNVLPIDSVFLKKRNKTFGNSGNGFYASFTGGLGYLIAPLPKGYLPDFYKEYLKELRSGNSYHLNAFYFFNELMGIGLHYAIFNTTNSIDRVIVYTNRDTLVGPLSDNITTNYFAPTFYIKFGDSKQAILPMLAVGLGYTNYRNDASLAIPFKITASSVGLHFTGILDINMGYNWALSFKGGVYSGAFTKAEVTDVNSGITRVVNYTEPDNISRVDLHIGLRYKFGNN